jgi:methylated-DNA-[protein]-cysteine S-methyltransferase
VGVNGAEGMCNRLTQSAAAGRLANARGYVSLSPSQLPASKKVESMRQNEQTDFVYKVIPSPVGKLTLVVSEAALVAILWEKERPGRVRLGSMQEMNDDPTLLEVERQLKQYFAGERNRFDIAVSFRGTEFQKKVWNALLAIPYGETRTYSEIATAIGSPKAVRAVGAANGRNPISIIAACHRVIGSSGELTGFAGGLAAKETLLQIEDARWGARKQIELPFIDTKAPEENSSSMQPISRR